MSGKMILLLLIYAAISLVDVSRLKKLGRREIMAYTAIMLVTVYLSLNYIYNLKWPFLGDFAYFLLGKWAQRIVEFLKVPT
ncbi:hypothetical protein [Paenibacillus sp. SI8]|uniref:hypothetical protein n=1 Tax=unclassified Paenibacillus TaxID=185978 RepID=UPI0034662D9D